MQITVPVTMTTAGIDRTVRILLMIKKAILDATPPTPFEQSQANEPEEEQLKPDLAGSRPIAENQTRNNHDSPAWLQANKNRWLYLVKNRQLSKEQFTTAIHSIRDAYPGEKPYLSDWIEQSSPKEVHGILGEVPA